MVRRDFPPRFMKFMFRLMLRIRVEDDDDGYIRNDSRLCGVRAASTAASGQQLDSRFH